MATQQIERGSSATGRRRIESWPLRWRDIGQFALAYVVLASLGLAVGLLITGPLSDTGLGRLDTEVARWWADQRSPDFNVASGSGSALADTFTIIAAVTALVLISTWLWKRWKESLTLGTALVLEALVFLTVSLTVGRERPPVEHLDTSPPTASFPSGHTGAAFAFYFGLALVVWWRTDNPWVRGLAVIAAFATSVTVALSRMYRGMHYLTDVTMGAALGVACLIAAAGIVTRAHRRNLGVTA